MQKTFAEFFAGIGLLRLGLENAGWKAKFANDIDENKFEMYWDNFQDAGETYLLGDVHDLTSSDIPPVTLATASFPCTDLSLAGYRRGLSGDQSGTFWVFTRLLQQMDGQRPPLLLIENVPGFLTSQRGQDFADAIGALNRLNYSCDAFVLDAANFVPQSRQRLFVVGIFDAPTTPNVAQVLAKRDPRLRGDKLSQFMEARNDLAWALLRIPAPPKRMARLDRAVERLRETSQRWWAEERVEYLLNQMAPRHRGVVDGLMRSRTVGYATVYRRIRSNKSMAEVRSDGIAGCLRTPKGGSSRQILLVAGKGKLKARFMTPREYARLMGAPDYEINVPDNQAYFGFGDAVCVPAIQWIGRSVLNPLAARLAGSAIGASAV